MATAAVAINTAAHARAGSTIRHVPRAWARRQPDPGDAPSAPSPLHPYATPTAVARGSFADQFNSRGDKRLDQLHQRIDIAAHDATAGLLAAKGPSAGRARADQSPAAPARRASGLQLSCLRYQNRRSLYLYLGLT